MAEATEDLSTGQLQTTMDSLTGDKPRVLTRKRTPGPRRQKSTFDPRKVPKPESVNPGDTLVVKVKNWPWWPVLVKSEQEVPRDVLHVKRTPEQHYIYFYGTYEYAGATADKLRVFVPEWWRARLENDELELEEYDSEEEGARTEAVRQALDPVYFAPIHREKVQQDMDECQRKEAEQEEKERLKRERAIEKKRAAARKKEREEQRRKAAEDQAAAEQLARKTSEQPVRNMPARRGRQKKKVQEQIQPLQAEKEAIGVESLSQDTLSNAVPVTTSSQSPAQSQELCLTIEPSHSQDAQPEPQELQRIPETQAIQAEEPVSETHSIAEEQPVLTSHPIQDEQLSLATQPSQPPTQLPPPIQSLYSHPTEQQPTPQPPILLQPILQQTTPQPLISQQLVDAVRQQPIQEKSVQRQSKPIHSQSSPLPLEHQDEPSTSSRGAKRQRGSSQRQRKRTRRTSYENQASMNAPVQEDSPIDNAIVPISPNRQEPMVPVKSDYQSTVSSTDDIKAERSESINRVQASTDENGGDAQAAHVAMRKRCIYIVHRLQTLLDQNKLSRWPASENELMQVAIQDIHIVQPTRRAIEETHLDYWVELAFQKEYTMDKDGYDHKAELGRILSSWESLMQS